MVENIYFVSMQFFFSARINWWQTNSIFRIKEKIYAWKICHKCQRWSNAFYHPLNGYNCANCVCVCDALLKKKHCKVVVFTISLSIKYAHKMETEQLNIYQSIFKLRLNLWRKRERKSENKMKKIWFILRVFGDIFSFIFFFSFA